MDRIFYRACAVTAAMAWMGMGPSNLTLGQLTQVAPPLVFETSPKHGGIGQGYLPRAIQEARLLELPPFAAGDAQADVAPADVAPEPTPTADRTPDAGSMEADFKATDLAEAESVVEASPSDLIDQWPMPQATPIAGSPGLLAYRYNPTAEPAEARAADSTPADVGPEEDTQLSQDYTSPAEYEAATRDAVARNQEYGQQRTDNTRAFLRAQTPLLKRGQWQFDYGLAYSILETDYPVLVTVGPDQFLTKEQVQFRSLDALLGFRYGMTERLQWFGSTTVGWQGSEVANGFDRIHNDTGGIGDLLTGWNYLLRAETERAPSIITSFSMSAPTGNPQDPRTLFLPGTGLGAWSFATDFLMVKSLDPLITFWGAGYRWFLDGSYSGEQVRVGDMFEYTFGTGFGINERVTVSGALLGAYQLDTRVNSVRIPGTAGDAISIRLAATIIKDCKIVEPFVNFGLTERVPDAFLGVIWTR